ncbi:Pentatricopeptide repeat-containing protein [Platanthera zijinensis]|uniref:Pentatricopeptide repeat-containing protein n=1 Tax=Platanthera zijinensis TaxID=2320716 RepID=A0AAP0BYK6_9ASPA
MADSFIFSLLHHRRHLPDLRIPHSRLVISGLIHDSLAASRLVQFVLRSGAAGGLPYALSIFNSLSRPDVFTWNAVIAGHAGLGSPDSAITLYFRMRDSHSPPNLYTFALLVKACHKSADCENSVKPAKKVHGQVMKTGVEDSLVVKNSLLSMYCQKKLFDDAWLLFARSRDLDLISWNILVSAFGKTGDLKTARFLFVNMPHRNLVSWSAMIDACVRVEAWAEALRLFGGLQDEGIRPDAVTLASVLKACAHSGALHQGRWIHLYIDRNRLCNRGSVILPTALVDMYCRCGCVEAAFEVFRRVSSKDVVLWNVMIGGLAMHGHGRRAVDLFALMKETAAAPNESTYIAVMCACTHAGMIDEGIEIFESMKADGVEPRREHYGCLADLMGRAGRVQKAEEVVLSMPMEPQAAQWGALMSACSMHNELDVGVRVGRRLIELEPHDAGRYVMLANMYADGGRWEEAMDVRREMEERAMKKETGCSLIE